GVLKDSVTWVGRRYLLTPVDLGGLRSFHPKLILLVGPQRGRLLVGSGNVTFTGFGHNHEVFTCLDWTPEDNHLQPVFAQAWNLINEVTQQWSYSNEVKKVLHKTTHVASWLAEEGESVEEIQLLHSLEEPLIDQCSRAIDSEAVDRITVLSPFLDQEAFALRNLYSRFQPQQLRLVLQEGQAVGNTESLERLRESDIPLQVYRFTDEEHYSHAKVYLFETADRAYLLTGSPNCTRSAWLTSAADGNLEVALLRRSDSETDFHPFLQRRFSLQQAEALDEVRLRQDQLPTPDGQDTIVRLLDVAIERGLLSVTLRVLSLPENVAQFQLRISGKPPRFISLESLEAGQHELQISLPTEIRTLMAHPRLVSIWGLTSDGEALDLHCNELWINNVDVLHQETTRAVPADTRTGTYLAEMALGSEEEWRDLYNALVNLVELEVKGLKQRRGTYTASPSGKKGKTQDDGEVHETNVRIITEEEKDREDEEIATSLFRESPLHTWLSHVRGGLPSAQLKTKDTKTGVDETPPTSDEGGNGKTKRVVRRQPPPRKVGDSFKRLVKKYIRSLSNEEYMQTVSIYHILAYYSIFQRIVGLLFQYGIISRETLVEYSTQINQGFFGTPTDPPPALCPRLNRHIQRVWLDEWQEQEVPIYALVTVFLSESGLSDSTDISHNGARTEDREQNLRIICTVLSIVGFPWVEDSIDEIARVSTEIYNQDGDALVLQALAYVNHHLSDLDTILDRWISKVSLELAHIDDVHLRDRLKKARMAYGFARYQALISLQESDTGVEAAQESLCRELIRWMREMDDIQTAREWADILVSVLRAQGRSRQVAKAVFEEGHKLFYSGYHEDSANKFRQSLLLAERIGDRSLVKKCEKYLGYADFFLKG
ncbi:MAG: hypothetical protein ACP5JJ_00765, partial [Anaerolineae bacterium]